MVNNLYQLSPSQSWYREVESPRYGATSLPRSYVTAIEISGVGATSPAVPRSCVAAIGIPGVGATSLRYRGVAAPQSRYLEWALRVLRYREVASPRLGYLGWALRVCGRIPTSHWQELIFELTASDISNLQGEPSDFDAMHQYNLCDQKFSTLQKLRSHQNQRGPHEEPASRETCKAPFRRLTLTNRIRGFPLRSLWFGVHMAEIPEKTR